MFFLAITILVGIGNLAVYEVKKMYWKQWLDSLTLVVLLASWNFCCPQVNWLGFPNSFWASASCWRCSSPGAALQPRNAGVDLTGGECP